jgi:hypothetical protein
MTKKGQAEMIGLVIIVIMITLGMLFLVRFSLEDNPEKKIFTRKGLAYSSMSAIMKTQVECVQGSTTVPLSLGRELIADCAGGSTEYLCDDKDSCMFLSDAVSAMLDETLGAWHKEYVFTSVLLGEEGKDLLEGGNEVNSGFDCENARERDSSGLFPLYVDGIGLVENSLFICE